MTPVDLAIAVAFSGPGLKLVLSYLAMVCGGALALCGPRPLHEPAIGRGRFILLFLAISAVTTLNESAWFAAKLQIGTIAFPIGALTWQGTLMAIGWATFRAARGRRIDIGLSNRIDSSLVVLPFLPVILAFLSPGVSRERREEGWLLRGRRAFYAGFAIVALSTPLSISILNSAGEAGQIGKGAAISAVAARTRYQGIEEVLVQLADDLRRSGAVASAAGPLLRLTIDIPVERASDQEWRSRQIPEICDNAIFAAVLASGAVVEVRFANEADPLIVGQVDCPAS